MSEALRAAGFAVVAALSAYVLRSVHREMGRAVSLAAGLMLFLFMLRIFPFALFFFF